MGQAADELSATQVSPYGAAAPDRQTGSPSAEELRARIGEQRSELGRDLEVLGDKVSPGRMVERRREAARQSVRGFKDRIMGAADSATSRVSDTAGSVTGSVTGTAGAISDKVTSVPGNAMGAAQGNPLAVGLIAFGAGAVIASLLPTSEKERRFAEQTATPALQKAAEQAGTVAQQAVEELKPMAQEAAESLKGTAQDAAQQVKQEAQTAAEEAKGAAQGAAEEVKSSASTGSSGGGTTTF